MLKYLRALFAFLFLLVMVPVAHGAEPAVRFFLGANGVWYQGSADLPDDLEIGGTARASLSPHISAVGSAFYGTQEAYLRGTAGARITVTDTDNRDMSVGLGAEYQASSKVSVRPQEWLAVVQIGYRPYPTTAPRVILVARGEYGLASEQAAVLIGVRYSLTPYQPEPGENP